MTIADLAELFTTYNAEFTATADEITAWNTLTATGDDTTVTSVGLWGQDLTDFNADCVTLGDLCDVADYVDYNGWGVGVNFADGTEDTADGVAFTDSTWCVHLYWSGSSSTNFVGVVQSDTAIDADHPTSSEETYEEAADAFAAWAYDDTTTNTDPVFAFSFFEAGDTEFYFEAGDKISIWTTKGIVGTPDNVENVDFELVGAATLTAATSVVVAALLF